MTENDLKKFVELWGRMGSVRGINNSTAKIHALLTASGNSLSPDDIAGRVAISRGNESVCVKDLKNWGIVELIKEPGDRRDFYVTEPDVWKMFFAIANERKRREFDPLVEVVRQTLPSVPENSASAVSERLTEMEELLTTLDIIGERLLANPKSAHSVLSLL